VPTRGYIYGYNPRPATIELLANVRAVLREYEAYLPLTLRQVYYRLIGLDVIEKTEQAYGRLGIHVANARRAGIIPFDSITDADVEGLNIPRTDLLWRQEDFWKSTERQAKTHSRFPAEGQPYRIIVWTEAAGTVTQLERGLDDLPVTVHSGGGQTSLTMVKAVADAVMEEDRPTVLLHVGDHDPSGDVIWRSFTEDVGAFVADDGGPEFVPVRLALTLDQIIDHDVIEQPHKRATSQAVLTKQRAWAEEQIERGGTGLTAQLEALPPDVLLAIVRGEIDNWVDQDALAERIAGEEEDRAVLLARVREIREGN
jgi:hypothetical protein